MKIAVFRNKFDGEILIFAVKGKAKDFSAFDGFKEYFGKVCGRKVSDYLIELGHIGAGEALMITPNPRVEFGGESKEIDDDWFEEDGETPKFSRESSDISRRVSQHLDNNLCAFVDKIPGARDLSPAESAVLLTALNDAVHGVLGLKRSDSD